MTVAAIAGVGFLIVLTGYLIIYNIFSDFCYERYTVLRAFKDVGTTGKQIKKIIRRQALLLSTMEFRVDFLLDFL